MCLCRKGYSLQRGVLQGRLIRFAAFGCYGSAKCASTLCSHLNCNLPSFLHTCYLSSPTLTNEEMRNDFIGFYCRFVYCEGSADESNGEKVGKNFVFHEKVVPLHR